MNAPGVPRLEQSVSRPAAVPRGRGAPVLRPRKPGRRHGRQAGRHALPRRRRHVGQRQVIAGQLRPAPGAPPRADGRGRARPGAWRSSGPAAIRSGRWPARWPTTACCFDDYRPEGLTLAEIVEATLRMSKLGLVDIYEQAHLDEGVNLLVVVDQFEELFRYRQPAASGSSTTRRGPARKPWHSSTCCSRPGPSRRVPIYVVLTMRSDFLGDCAQFPGLPEAINEGQYLVPRMTRDERRAAIAGRSAWVAQPSARPPDAAGQRRRRQPRPALDPAARLEPHVGALAERRWWRRAAGPAALRSDRHDGACAGPARGEGVRRTATERGSSRSARRSSRR